MASSDLQFNASFVNLNYSSKMKGVIDVLAMQREKRLTLHKTITIDYTKAKTDSFTVARFIFECGNYNWNNICHILSIENNFILFSGLKLDAHFLTISTAATLYHRFMREASPGGYDPFVIIKLITHNIFWNTK